MDDQRTIKIYQIKTIPEDEMYFSPYLENLFIQYNTQKNYLIIKVILIFCIVLSLLAGLLKLPLSSPVVFIVDTFEVFLVVFLGLLTIIILINLLNKGSLQKEFLLFISAHNNHNLQTLYEELQVHELQIKKDDYNERNTPLYDYFRAISKINEGKYQETIELLNKSVNQVFNSFAIKYELLKLLGICFLRIGENEKSQKCFIDATAGFRKIHFLEPISNQDLKDGYLIDGKT